MFLGGMRIAVISMRKKALRKVRSSFGTTELINQ